MRRFLRLLLGLAACGMLVFSGLKLYGYYAEANAGSKVNDALAKEALVYREPETERKTETDTGFSPDAAPISVKFDILRETNEDIIGWLYCEDTPISYPIVQGEDNSFYLHRLPDGSYNSGGTLFADYRNAGDFSDLNTIVYGHNMKNNSMFGTLTDYREQSYYEEHPVLWLLTPDGDYRLELIAGYVTQNDAEIYSGAGTHEELLTQVENAVRRSTFSSGAALGENDRIVTLSTCSYEYENARYVLLARLCPVEEDAPAS